MEDIVVKFGGTSLADAGQFRKVKKIIESNKNRKYVVASAPGKRFDGDIKVTDLLIECYELAANGKSYDEKLLEISNRFKDIISELELELSVDEEIEKIREHLSTEPDLEYMASRGEFLNSIILAKYLDYSFVDPAWCVTFTEDGVLDLNMTMRTMRAALNPLDRVVIAGFYGTDSNNTVHTFSRGGSDITGSLVALAVGAQLYENWTDVSGLLAADPRIVENPRTVSYLTYRELRTLSYMGASVIHTDAVLPAADAGITVNIRNTNRPEDEGTRIVRKLPENAVHHPITGVAGRKGMSVIQIEKVMVSDGAGFSAMMLDLLKNRGIPFEQCLTGIDTITLLIKSEILEQCREELLSEIKEVLNPDYLCIKENLSIIAVVGEKATESSDANVRVLQALNEEDIEISTINQGAGKLNLLVGIPEDAYEKAIRAIYKTLEKF